MSRTQGRFSGAAISESRPARLYLIAAVASNGVIGAQGQLPWHLPEDLKHFRTLTLGHPVIMGRRTWESFVKPLPGRENIVVTRQARYAAPGARVTASLELALALCARQPFAFVIGGEQLYRSALPWADVLVLTEIHRAYEGDTSFPAIEPEVWRELSRAPETSSAGLRFDFVRYERRS